MRPCLKIESNSKGMGCSLVGECTTLDAEGKEEGWKEGRGRRGERGREILFSWTDYICFSVMGQPWLISKIGPYKLCIMYLQLVKSYYEGKAKMAVNIIILKPSNQADQ